MRRTLPLLTLAALSALLLTSCMPTATPQPLHSSPVPVRASAPAEPSQATVGYPQLALGYQTQDVRVGTAGQVYTFYLIPVGGEDVGSTVSDDLQASNYQVVLKDTGNRSIFQQVLTRAQTQYLMYKVKWIPEFGSNDDSAWAGTCNRLSDEYLNYADEADLLGQVKRYAGAKKAETAKLGDDNGSLGYVLFQVPDPHAPEVPNTDRAAELAALQNHMRQLDTRAALYQGDDGKNAAQSGTYFFADGQYATLSVFKDSDGYQEYALAGFDSKLRVKLSTDESKRDASGWAVYKTTTLPASFKPGKLTVAKPLPVYKSDAACQD